MRILLLIILLLSFADSMRAQSQLWPGDVNNNGVANHVDLLYIGAAYGEDGTPRPNGTLSWEAQDVPQGWGDNVFDTLSNAYADCNGDGLVDMVDVEAIGVNFGLTHGEIHPESMIFPPGDILLEDAFFDGSPIAVTEGELIALDLVFGDSTEAVNDVYGLAFILEINGDYVNADSVDIQFDDWLGSLDETVTFQRVVDNRVYASISRINQTNVSGGARIGTLHLVIEDDVPSYAPDVEVVTVQEVFLVDKDLQQHYHVVPNPLSLDFSSANHAPRLEGINIYPNPVKDGICQISGITNYPNATVTLMDVAGRQFPPRISGEQLNVQSLPPGLYFLRIQTDTGWHVERLAIP